jgi:hypothetical protein
MEPLDERELNQLLRRWEAPNAPSTLGERVTLRHISWWRWLLTGTIRVPVPVGIAAVLALAVWILSSRVWQPVPVAEPSGSVTLADFRPVRQLEPKIVRSNDDSDPSDKR